MDLNDEQIERVNYWIKTIFYYVEYPEPVQEYWWKDREENEIFMEDMGLDHLKASARRVQIDIDEFPKHISQNSPDFHIYKKTLLVPAKKKQMELEEIFRKNANI